MTAATDGRVQRGERNRTAIVDALLALLEAGNAKPSARAIAEHAGCSVRTVFQHFDDMEVLYATCVERQQERLTPLLAPIDGAASRDARVDALVAQRSRVFERIAPVRRAAMLAAPTSPVLKEGLDRTARRLRDQVESVFAAELRGSDRQERLAALDVATSFDTWEHLRTTQGLPVGAARRVVALLVRSLLS